MGSRVARRVWVETEDVPEAPNLGGTFNAWRLGDDRLYLVLGGAELGRTQDLREAATSYARSDDAEPVDNLASLCDPLAPGMR